MIAESHTNSTEHKDQLFVHINIFEKLLEFIIKNNKLVNVHSGV